MRFTVRADVIRTEEPEFCTPMLEKLDLVGDGKIL
jgi:hypothetical protein